MIRSFFRVLRSPRSLLPLIVVTMVPGFALAAGGDAPDLGNALLKMLAALALVLGLFALGIYLLKRFGVVPWSAQGGELRIERVVSLGSRSRLAIVRAGDQRFLLGITSNQISRIAELPEADEDSTEHERKSR